MKILKLLLIVFFCISTIFSRSLEIIKNDGVINIGIRKAPGVYMKDGKRMSGFHYDLALELARFLKVKAKFVILKQSDYFETATIFKKVYSDNTNISNRFEVLEKPVVFKKVDIICDAIVDFGTYGDLMTIVTLYPIADVYMVRKKQNIETKSRLKNRYISVSDNSYLYARALIVLQDINSATILPSQDEYDALNKLLKNSADVAIIASDTALLVNKNDEYKGLEVDRSLTAAINGIAHVGWAVDKKDRSLATEVIFFIELIKNINNKFDAYWRRNFPDQYGSYLLELKNYKTD